MSSEPVTVVCAIIERGSRLLAARRNAHQSNAGLWEFPGGKVHEGERPEEALKREIVEELAVQITTGSQLTPSVYAYPWISIRLLPFMCGIAGGEPFPHEHAEVRWVDQAEAVRLSWAPADIPILQEYLRLCAL